jgi:hypothetical protein
VWGTWNGIVRRDAEAIRRVGSMLRFFGRNGTGGGSVLRSLFWEPHTVEAVQASVYASRWPSEDGGAADGVVRVWSMVNRAGRNLTGQQLWITPSNTSSNSGSGVKSLTGQQQQLQYFDCYRGVELQLEPAKPLPPNPNGVPGYNWFAGANAYVGHGAGTNVDGSPTSAASASGCAALCDSFGDECGCVTYDPSTQSCWRRGECSPAQFDYSGGGAYEVYLKTSTSAQGQTSGYR